MITVFLTTDPSVMQKQSVGWGLIEVWPKAFMTITYKGTFKVNVYQQENIANSASALYYYSPALIIDPSLAVSNFSNFNKRFEMTFTVLMWDNEFEEFILDAIAKKIGAMIPRSSLATFLIEEIRLDTSDLPVD